MFRNFIQGDLSVRDYCRKMKSMAGSLGNHGCVVFDHNLILNALQGLNKWCNRLRAIITHSTPFSTFHKVRDDLVMEEITLGPNMPVAPLQAFYSNNTTASPPQGHGCRRGRGHDRGDEGRGSGSSAPDQGNHPRPAQPPGPPSTTFGLEPSTCTSVRLVGRVGGGGGKVATTPPSTAVGTCHCARPEHGQPSLHATLGVDLEDQQSLANPFNTMMLQMPPSLMKWITDSGLPVTSIVGTVLPSPFYINNVLITPEIIKNLLSICQFTTDNWCLMKFDPFWPICEGSCYQEHDHQV
jgi:hypothetical protein